MEFYFVKSLFSGWHQVDRDHYEAFCANIRENATAAKDKEAIIKQRTRVISDTSDGDFLEICKPS